MDAEKCRFMGVVHSMNITRGSSVIPSIIVILECRAGATAYTSHSLAETGDMGTSYALITGLTLYVASPYLRPHCPVILKMADRGVRLPSTYVRFRAHTP